MSNERLAAVRSDTPALLLIDTRASQSLERIRLPVTLKDRIARAQHRANAAKDGVLMFSNDSHDSAASTTMTRQVTTAEAVVTNMSVLLDELGDPLPFSTANARSNTKMHIPTVILSHKMRDFEARSSAGRKVAQLILDPADQRFQSLSLEAREEVMSAMQTKIRQIAGDVEAKFARITKTMDANGIFDVSTNIQRAQTLCLVDLQRQCQLNRLRDEVMREVIDIPASTMTKNLNTPNNVNQCLLEKPVVSAGQKRRKPIRRLKLPAKKPSMNNQLSPLPQLFSVGKEWTRRYQATGAQTMKAVCRRSERQRSDILGHLSVNCPRVSISTTLRHRLKNQQATWKCPTPTSENGATTGEPISDAGKDSHSKQQLYEEMYVEMQDHIRKRLIVNERQTRTAAVAVRNENSSGRAHQATYPLTAPVNTMAISSSTAIQTNGLTSLENDRLLSPEAADRTITLGISASEPILPASKSRGVLKPQKHSRCGTRVQVPTLEHKLVVDPFGNERQRGLLIGAPTLHGTLTIIGHHSEARLKHRRDAAQTWTWHRLPDTVSNTGVNVIERKEKGDCFKENIHFDQTRCGTDDDRNEGENDQNETVGSEDDFKNVDTSRTEFSIRSTVSLSSEKRKTSTSQSKTKWSPTQPRRASRGVADRSVKHMLINQDSSFYSRLERIWRVLQFSFSDKLTMLERLSALQDADAFTLALERWERFIPLVDIRQRMKRALSRYEEFGVLQSSEWLTSSEMAQVSALPLSVSAAELNSSATPHLDDIKDTSAFVDWVRKYLDVVTAQTQKLANDFKAQTGEELQLQ